MSSLFFFSYVYGLNKFPKIEETVIYRLLIMATETTIYKVWALILLVRLAISPYGRIKKIFMRWYAVKRKKDEYRYYIYNRRQTGKRM